jgi:FKBP-type peptidyl-prolyl cis-trans isomerase 2
MGEPALNLGMPIERGDEVTIEYTGRLDDGTVVDTSRRSVAEESGLAEEHPERAYEPLTVEIGAEEIIEGLEEGLVGLDEGTTTTIAVPPEQGYGEWSEDLVEEFATEDLREELSGPGLEEGAYLQGQRGEQGEIVHVDEEVVRVDFNPELADERLEFEVEVVAVE